MNVNGSPFRAKPNMRPSESDLLDQSRPHQRPGHPTYRLMPNDYEVITADLRHITADPDEVEPEYHDTDLRVLRSLSDDALDALLLLKPITVTQQGRQKAFTLVGGFGTYRAVRAARGEFGQVRALKLNRTDASLARAVDLLIGPALEGAGHSDAVAQRWLGLHRDSNDALSRLGFSDLSRSAIADLLGVSRSKLYRLIPSENDSRIDDDEKE